MNAPPPFAVRLISALLPPSKREQVLGDLQERLNEAQPEAAARAYVIDALKTVPHLTLQAICGREPTGQPQIAGRTAITSRAEMTQILYDDAWRSGIFKIVGGPTAVLAIVMYAIFSGDTYFRIVSGALACPYFFFLVLGIKDLFYASGAGMNNDSGAHYRAALLRVQKIRRRDGWLLLNPLGLALIVLPVYALSRHPDPRLPSTFLVLGGIGLVLAYQAASRLFQASCLKKTIARLDRAAASDSNSEVRAL